MVRRVSCSLSFLDERKDAYPLGCCDVEKRDAGPLSGRVPHDTVDFERFFVIFQPARNRHLVSDTVMVSGNQAHACFIHLGNQAVRTAPSSVAGAIQRDWPPRKCSPLIVRIVFGY